MARSHLAVAARWPLGIALTSWRYMWRTTPLRRREIAGSPDEDAAPPLPAGTGEVQAPEHGSGPLFHRHYRIRIRQARLPARELMAWLQRDPDAAAPSEFATFRKTAGEDGTMRVGDEYVVRMAGPWDGPVRVVELSETSMRLATLPGHIEAGQIEFAAADRDDGELEFRIESWARAGDRLSNLLYTHARMAKEIQLHMWTSFLERVAELSGGRRSGAISIETRRVSSDAQP
ncbi:MAG TPA: DUF1990 family protein [Solirubrobacteraceae bacterium]|jgi:hypothetical protein